MKNASFGQHPLPIWSFLLGALSVALFVTCIPGQPMLAWKKLIASTRDDDVTGVSYDGIGNIYVTGKTFSSLGAPNIGSSDVFVAKYDLAGNQTWIRQFGSVEWDGSDGVSVDKLGNIYVTGATQGLISGFFSGGIDAFVTKYDPAGNAQWIRQFGTPQIDSSNSVCVDGLGNVYVSGQTDGVLGAASFGSRDLFVGKFDSAGNQIWLKQSGSGAFEVGLGIASDGRSNVYAVGFTEPHPPTNSDAIDAYVTKFDSTGNFGWTRTFGTSSFDQALGVYADGAGNIYVSGVTNGLLGPNQYGSQDAFLSKFDDTGNLVWTHQFGGTVRDLAFAIAADPDGNIYVGGEIISPEAGTIMQADPFVVKLDANGDVKWNYQLTGPTIEMITSLTVDQFGGVYAAGKSLNFARVSDAMIIKIVDIPEPSGFSLVFTVAIILSNARVKEV